MNELELEVYKRLNDEDAARDIRRSNNTVDEFVEDMVAGKKIIRNAVLEEAAKVADKIDAGPGWQPGTQIAAAIRELKE